MSVKALQEQARRQERLCRDLADRALAEQALLPPAERAEGLRRLLLVIREHEHYPAVLIGELTALLHEIEPPTRGGSSPDPLSHTEENEMMMTEIDRDEAVREGEAGLGHRARRAHAKLAAALALARAACEELAAQVECHPCRSGEGDFCLGCALAEEAAHLPWLLDQVQGLAVGSTPPPERLEALAGRLGEVLDVWLEEEGRRRPGRGPAPNAARNALG